MKTPQLGFQKVVTTTYQANRLFAFELAKGLIAAGALDQQQAADIMVRTADQLRKISEEEVEEQLGEAYARGFEQVAAWLLGSPGELL